MLNSQAPSQTKLDRNTNDNSIFISVQPYQRWLIIGFYLVYLVYVGFQQTSSNINNLTQVFAALSLNLVLLAVPFLLYKPSYGWFHPLIAGSLFTFLNQVLRFTPLYTDGLDTHMALPGMDAESLTSLVAFRLVLSSIGLIAYYIGFFILPIPPIPQLHFPKPVRVGLKASLVVAFSLLVFLIFIQSRGGLASHLLAWTAGDGRRLELEDYEYQKFLIRCGTYACLCWLALERYAFLRPSFWVCSGLSLGMSFLTTGSRSNVFFPIVLGLVIWMFRERKISPFKFSLVLILGFFVFSILGGFRSEIDFSSGTVPWERLTDFSQTFSDTSMERYTRRNTSGDATLAILALVPNTVKFLYGQSYWALLTFPIPRILWPEKPEFTGPLAGRIFFGSTAGFPPDAVGEAYWNFHIAGIIFVFLLYGILHFWLAAWFRKNLNTPAMILLYSVTLFFLIPTTLAVSNWAEYIIIILVFCVLSGRVSLSSRHV